ncbi:MAG: 2-oxo acid dehydrogenase subunit E2 [Cytophagales bacterium]|nr:2-oxo acid dehydrogenase subunit E2 [Cytophagales bacterium]
MAVVEMLMPKMGESVMEGTILSWLKTEGDIIEEEESILEVATDKIDTDIPSPYTGTLKEIIAQEGDVVQVGNVIALIETDQEIESDTDFLLDDDSESLLDENTQEEKSTNTVGDDATVTNSYDKSTRFYSPLVKSIAKKENLSLETLESIQGSGRDGRVTKKDILAYIKNKKTSNKPFAMDLSAKKSLSADADIIEMDRMRQIIAERMVESKRISAHVTSWVEADVTNIVYWRNRNKNKFKDEYNTILTYTPIFLSAVAKALTDYPMMNISVDGKNIILKKNINVGMAVALPNGNLIVPVIKNADQLNLVEMTKAVNDVAKRARNNELRTEDLEGGTFSVSNMGTFGNVMGTPILVQPQVGILALGSIEKKPSVIETPTGDTIGIRHKMFLSHSYDHRVVDGALGGMFVRKVADYLEEFDLDFEV